MIRKALTGLLIVLLFTIPASAKNVGGIDLQDTITVGGQALELNGAGVRKKFVIKVYVGALYLKQKSDDAAKILNADEPMAIRLQFIYDGLASEKLVSGWNDGFAATSGDKMDSFKNEIAAFNACFNEEAKKNDIYDIAYVPGEGVSVTIKGKLKGTIKGLEFKKAVFGIWLGEKSELGSLKQGMLGK